jgi:hypothetical protein
MLPRVINARWLTCTRDRQIGREKRERERERERQRE